MVRGMRYVGTSLLVLWSCGGAAPRAETAPVVPATTFMGEETEDWLAEESEPTGRTDLLLAFEASARSYGCHTEQIGSQTTFSIHGERRSFFGVSASCREGTVAIITLKGGRVRIGCAKPTTHEACDALLRSIAENG